MLKLDAIETHVHVIVAADDMDKNSPEEETGHTLNQ